MAEKTTDLDQLLILFQRRYNILREIKEITDELAEASSRHDGVSVELELQMRMDKLQLCDRNWQDICMHGENGDEAQKNLFRSLVLEDPEDAHSSVPKEEKLYEIRRACRKLIREIRERDRIISLQTVHDKSFYYQKL